MKSALRFALFFVAVVCLSVSARIALAQGTDLGTIRGTVKDTSGAVVANAKVTITDSDTNTSRQTSANGEGDFEMFGLKSGSYKVSVTAAG